MLFLADHQHLLSCSQFVQFGLVIWAELVDCIEVLVSNANIELLESRRCIAGRKEQRASVVINPFDFSGDVSHVKEAFYYALYLLKRH